MDYKNKVICFTSYPTDAPSVYHRLVAYRPHWNEYGAQLVVYSFFTKKMYKKRKRAGIIATLYKAVMMLFCTVRMLARVLFMPQGAIIIIHREVFPLGAPWLELWIIRKSKSSFYDIDDAIWEPPSNGLNQRNLFVDPNRVSKIMSSADCVVVGNQYLAEYARQVSDNVATIPTSYEDVLGSILEDTYEINSVPTIVWIGNLGNAFYLDVLNTVFQKLLLCKPFRLKIIGGEDIRKVKFPGIDIEYIPWTREAEIDGLMSSDIGIMPLPDMPYEKGKCAFKLIQYMSCGMPVVASPVGVNVDVITAETGFLAENKQQWYDALKCLIDDQDLRRNLGRQGYQRFKVNYSRSVNAKKWLELLEPEFNS